MQKLFVFLMLAVFLVTAMGCNAIDKNQVTKVNQTNSGKDFEYAENLTLQDVTETIAEAGIELIEIPGAGQSSRLNEVTPSVFSVNRSGETMLIYVCPSIGIRKSITPDPFYAYMYQNKRGDYDYLPIVKICKNVLILDKVPLSRLTRGLGAYDADRWNRLSEAAFKLNDAQETTLCGSSPHWEGKLTVKHYSYWYQDKDGTMHCESYHKDNYKIKYLGPSNEVNEVAYSMEYPGGSRNVTGDRLRGGCIELSGRDDRSFSEDGVYKITLEWNGHKESFNLKKN